MSTDETNENESGSKNIKGFLKSSIIILVVILGYFFAGTIVLYGCKLAKSGMFPTDENTYPYTDNKINNNSPLTNIFATDDGSHSISFEYGEYKLIPALVHYRDTINIGFVNYILTNIISLLQFSYSTTSSILKSVHSAFSENIIILLSPFILGILSFILLVGNTGYLIYLWFKNLGLFLKQGVKEVDGTINWGTDKSWIFGKLGAYCWYAAFIVLFFFIYPTFPFISAIFMPIVMLTILSYGSVYNDGTAQSKIGVFGIFKMILKYYKSSALILSGYGISMVATTKLGPVIGSSLFGIINLIILLEYFGVINQFKSTTLENPQPIITEVELPVQTGGRLSLKRQLKKLVNDKTA